VSDQSPSTLPFYIKTQYTFVLSLVANVQGLLSHHHQVGFTSTAHIIWELDTRSIRYLPSFTPNVVTYMALYCVYEMGSARLLANTKYTIMVVAPPELRCLAHHNQSPRQLAPMFQSHTTGPTIAPAVLSSAHLTWTRIVGGIFILVDLTFERLPSHGARPPGDLGKISPLSSSHGPGNLI
jgi:hypothetical protein